MQGPLEFILQGKKKIYSARGGPTPFFNMQSPRCALLGIPKEAHVFEFVALCRGSEYEINTMG